MSGRKAQAARNDELILAAARAVFTADPGAPISAVADKAGVGISALYRRYGSKEALLQKLCGDGLKLYILAAERALASTAEPWEAFAQFMRDVVDYDTNSLTIALAGTFQPTEELYQDATRSGVLGAELFARVTAAGVIRPGVALEDIAMIFEQLASVKLGDEARTVELRHRYLALLLDALHMPPTTSELPGPPPTEAELRQRWSSS